MELHIIDFRELVVPETRQRREFKPEDVVKLADSISENGLIQPIVIRKNEDDQFILVAGERRLRAMQYVWNFGQKIRCGEQWFDEYQVPCLYQGEMDPLAAYEMELEENIRRVDLSWQEKATATSRLFELRRQRAADRGEEFLPVDTITQIAEEVRGTSQTSIDTTRKEILISKHLDDPDVQKAKSAEDAFKVLKRKEEMRKSVELGESVGRTFSAAIHELHQGDCLSIMSTLPSESIDVILTDPPYGIDAQDFGDSNHRIKGDHFYDDSFESWERLIRDFAPHSFRLAKPQAHAYIFCDIDNFPLLRSVMASSGWRCFRTPIIWCNPTAMRTPWPEHGPQRKWQMCLYAVKGNKNVLSIKPDLITYPSDSNVNHPAQKPVGLYLDLLRRSCRPGDVTLDAFCGSGTIFPAAHDLKCKAIGIELDPAAYGIAVKRLKDLR